MLHHNLPTLRWFLSRYHSFIGLFGLVGLLLAAGCGDGEYPAIDMCVTTVSADAGTASDTDQNAESETAEGAPEESTPAAESTSKWCAPCQSDADCVIAGDPCCHPDLKYACVHNDRIEDLPSCPGECSLPPEKPDNALCQCVDGTCHLPPVNL